MNIKTKCLALFVKLKQKMNIGTKPIDTTSSCFVLLEGSGNVFWTTEDGSNHDGFKILHRGSEDEMIEKWKRYYSGRL